MWWTLGILLLVFLAAQAYVRLAPSDAGHWHAVPDTATDRTLDGGVIRVIPAYADTLKRLDAIARDTPRTQVLAGGPGTGMTTYVTRTRFWGFPDYTTVARRGEEVVIYARLRFGRSDMGVNRARVDRWLAALEEGEGA
ncbi:MAG: DUF1499 domain-containing protein [Pseudooceanicola sp.]